MKTLFIIDIQKKYNKNFDDSYLSKITNYLNKNYYYFDKIVCIMENNKILGDFLNEEVLKKLTVRPVFKCYDAEYSFSKLKKSNKFKVSEKGLQPLFEIPNGDFYLRDNTGYIIGSRDENNVKIDYLNLDLYYLMNLIRNTDIFLIGGGLNNCVKKTQDYLKCLGIKSTILKDLCYTIYPVQNPCNTKKFNVFIENKQKD